MMTRLRWWLIVNLSGVVLIYSYLQGYLQQAIELDSTYICVALLVLYFLSTVYIGVCLFTGQKLMEDKMWFTAETMQHLGIIGTMIGLISVLSIFFDGTGLSAENIQEVNPYIAAGAGTAFYTSVVGFITSIFLKTQLIVISDD